MWLSRERSYVLLSAMKSGPSVKASAAHSSWRINAHTLRCSSVNILGLNGWLLRIPTAYVCAAIIQAHATDQLSHGGLALLFAFSAHPYRLAVTLLAHALKCSIASCCLGSIASNKHIKADVSSHMTQRPSHTRVRGRRRSPRY